MKFIGLSIIQFVLKITDFKRAINCLNDFEITLSFKFGIAYK